MRRTHFHVGQLKISPRPLPLHPRAFCPSLVTLVPTSKYFADHITHIVTHGVSRLGIGSALQTSNFTQACTARRVRLPVVCDKTPVLEVWEGLFNNTIAE